MIRLTFLLLAGTLLCPVTRGSDCCSKEQKPGELLQAQDSMPVISIRQAYPPLERRSISAEQGFTDHEGENFQIRPQDSKIIVMTFVYTRCANPFKCSLTGVRFGKLQKALSGHFKHDPTLMLLVSFDPDRDTPEDMKRFAEKSGFILGANGLFIKCPWENSLKLFEDIDVGVNFNGHEVNSHDMELLIFDKKHRLAVRYTKGLWDNEQVLKDIQKLLGE